MISAVAQKYNIHPQTLRLYEREGLLKPSRTDGNTRLYSEEDLEQLETILSLTRDLGVNLAGVEIILNMRRKIEQMQHEVNEFMEYVKHELARGIDDWEQRLSHRARQVVADRSGPRAAADAVARRRQRASRSARRRRSAPGFGCMLFACRDGLPRPRATRARWPRTCARSRKLPRLTVEEERDLGARIQRDRDEDGAHAPRRGQSPLRRQLREALSRPRRARSSTSSTKATSGSSKPRGASTRPATSSSSPTRSGGSARR